MIAAAGLGGQARPAPCASLACRPVACRATRPASVSAAFQREVNVHSLQPHRRAFFSRQPLFRIDSHYLPRRRVSAQHQRGQGPRDPLSSEGQHAQLHASGRPSQDFAKAAKERDGSKEEQMIAERAKSSPLK